MNLNVMTKQGRRNYIRLNAPVVWRSLMLLEEGDKQAKEYFKNKYGIFWKLRVSKEVFEKRQEDICVKLKIKEIDNRIKGELTPEEFDEYIKNRHIKLEVEG